MGDEADDGAKLPTHMEQERRETKYAKKYVKQLMNKLSNNPKLNFFENKLQRENTVTKTNKT